MALVMVQWLFWFLSTVQIDIRKRLSVLVLLRLNWENRANDFVDTIHRSPLLKLYGD